MGKQTIFIQIDDDTKYVLVDISKGEHLCHLEEKKEAYVLTEDELRELLSNIWDKCWQHTSQGWNGEIQPLSSLSLDDFRAERETYQQEKQEYINTVVK